MKLIEVGALSLILGCVYAGGWLRTLIINLEVIAAKTYSFHYNDRYPLLDLSANKVGGEGVEVSLRIMR